MTTMNPMRVGVLVGGRSRRMGRDKALLDNGGRTLLERTVEVLRATPVGSTAPVGLVGEAPFEVPADLGIHRFTDRPGLGGPLAGLLGAVDAAPRAAWLIVACDLPLLSPEAIGWLLGERRPETVAVVPRLGAARGRIEPLFALYEPRARPLLERLAAEPDPKLRSLQRLRGLPGVATPLVPRPLRPAWTNVNTPVEWDAAVSRLRPKS